MRHFKRERFGRNDVTLHTGGHRPPAGSASPCSSTQGAVARFATASTLSCDDSTTPCIACAIRKDAHLAAYGAAALDPYTLSLNVLVARFFFALADAQETQPGVIVAERRDQLQ